MDVAQTSQLIQLILNAVLMTTACGLVLVGLVMRHTALHLRLQNLHQEYLDLVAEATTWSTVRPRTGYREQLTYLRMQQHRLRQGCRRSYHSLLATSTALWLLIVSTLLVALRSLLPWQWLIPLSLLPFVAGVAALLVAVGLAGIEFYRSRRLLQWEGQHLWETVAAEPRKPLRASPPAIAPKAAPHLLPSPPSQPQRRWR